MAADDWLPALARVGSVGRHRQLALSRCTRLGACSRIKLMKDQSLTILDRVLNNPQPVLGSVERNTEIKVVLFTLCALGWDPVSEIAFAFQIWRQKVPPAKAAQAADFVLQDGIGLCAVGEAKHWGAKDPAWDRGLKQIRRYQEALHTPRAFLTSGNRWHVFDESGSDLVDFTIDDLESKTARSLVDRLTPFLGKGKFAGQTVDPETWQYGLCPRSLA